ncbi:helix-turn-helix domain-containing protein [Marinospirillum alkaliphilum]|uniref:Helix-turn-helix domain-containing protein n=1 Tax=Marinospirillum alkaliphilum DSM 21637 TaxID=1122209 RepID=A0A1K1ZRK6_9GAMM|nr:AraC family transcriptional regulator [Marinospirillum alkaliphilum]SFX76759.1 Helix-turn-helix domain-containing protein [Marinospirillum alkaliphilum DSM 21637]
MLARIRSFPLPTRCLHHSHDHHQLVIALSGSAEFEIAGYGGRVDALHGCLVPSGEVHFYEGLGDNRHVVMDLPQLPQGHGFERLFDVPRYFTADTSLRLLLSFMDREASLWQHSGEAAAGMASVFLGSLHQRLFDAGPALPSPAGRLDMVKLEVYIQQHLAEKLPVVRLAQVACVSPGHFHQLFRDATGMTPGQYLLQARLERARELIQRTRLPLELIAGQVGFSSQSALTHAFRRYYGETPGKIRRLH